MHHFCLSDWSIILFVELLYSTFLSRSVLFHWSNRKKFSFSFFRFHGYVTRTCTSSALEGTPTRPTTGSRPSTTRTPPSGCWGSATRRWGTRASTSARSARSPSEVSSYTSELLVSKPSIYSYKNTTTDTQTNSLKTAATTTTTTTRDTHIYACVFILWMRINKSTL